MPINSVIITVHLLGSNHSDTKVCENASKDSKTIHLHSSHVKADPAAAPSQVKKHRSKLKAPWCLNSFNPACVTNCRSVVNLPSYPYLSYLSDHKKGRKKSKNEISIAISVVSPRCYCDLKCLSRIRMNFLYEQEKTLRYMHWRWIFDRRTSYQISLYLVLLIDGNVAYLTRLCQWKGCN